MFLFPENVRNKKDEIKINLRLQDFFNFQANFLKKQIRKKIKQGIYLTFTGIFFLIIAGYISFSNPNIFYIHLILIVSEPAGWFLLWTGLEKLFNSTIRIKAELQFYSKITQTTINFSSY